MKTYNKLPKVIEDSHLLLQWLVPLLDKFPRNRRFTVGERLESRLLEMLQHLVEAAYSREKSESLQQANRQLSVFRHLWRLSYELHLIDLRRYRYGSEQIVDIGKQIGAWHKAAGGRTS